MYAAFIEGKRTDWIYQCLLRKVRLGVWIKKGILESGNCNQSREIGPRTVENRWGSIITATHDVNNPRSGAVMKKLGMTYQYSYIEYWKPKGFLVTFRMYPLNLDGQTDRVSQGHWDRYPVHFVEKNI